MELPDRFKNLSKQFDECWRAVHSNSLSKEQNKHCLYWLKNINAVIEDLESNILGMEKAIKGDKMPEQHQRELEASEAGQEMFQRWLPIIMYSEMNRNDNSNNDNFNNQNLESVNNQMRCI